ncbi:hypothetical protein D3228_12200 [Leucobacter luti]|nr:hypothetical protein [Leucobacter luti]
MLMGERRHSRGGHDAGCRTLGVPLRGLRRFLKAADHAGAAALLDEALTAAVSEIVDWGDAWSASSAAEAVSAAIRVRITPHDGASHEVTHTR